MFAKKMLWAVILQKLERFDGCIVALNVTQAIVHTGPLLPTETMYAEATCARHRAAQKCPAQAQLKAHHL